MKENEVSVVHRAVRPDIETRYITYISLKMNILDFPSFRQGLHLAYFGPKAFNNFCFSSHDHRSNEIWPFNFIVLQPSP